MKLFAYLIVLVASVAGCATRLPRPQNLPSANTHQYIIAAKDSTGKPLEGARFTVTATDLDGYLDGKRHPNSFTEKLETDANGIITKSIEIPLAHHWRGGAYYKPENEAELARQSYPHGGRDIWGYFSDLTYAGELSGNKTVMTTNPAPAVVTIPIVFSVPSNYFLPSFHDYQYRAIDKMGAPVAGARIVAKAADLGPTKGNRRLLEASRVSHECTTDNDGRCSVRVPVKMRIHYRSDYVGESALNEFDSMKRSGDPDGYYGYLSSATATGTIANFLKSTSPPMEVTKGTLTGSELSNDQPINILVATPQDYFCDDLKKPEQSKIAARLEGWVKELKLSGDERSVGLTRICTQQFKSRAYVDLSFAHLARFNELKLNNYGIGVLVFDEIVRKLLDPIASASTTLPLDGYKIRITTQKSNFADKSSKEEFLTYDFYMPRDLVRQYKQADISGQKLINGSIMLLDNERIDLELK